MKVIKKFKLLFNKKNIIMINILILLYNFIKIVII